MLSRHPFSLASLQHTLDIFPSYFAAVSETYHIDFEMDITSHRKDGGRLRIDDRRTQRVFLHDPCIPPRYFVQFPVFHSVHACSDGEDQQFLDQHDGDNYGLSTQYLLFAIPVHLLAAACSVWYCGIPLAAETSPREKYTGSVHLQR